MINIKLCINVDNFSLSIVGHAGYNPGNDIVCASCSTISQTFIQTYTDLGYSGKFVNEDGLVKMDGEVNSDVKLLLKFVITGYSGLANAYPDNVSLEITDKNKVFT